MYALLIISLYIPLYVNHNGRCKRNKMRRKQNNVYQKLFLEINKVKFLLIEKVHYNKQAILDKLLYQFSSVSIFHGITEHEIIFTKIHVTITPGPLE